MARAIKSLYNIINKILLKTDNLMGVSDLRFQQLVHNIILILYNLLLNQCLMFLLDMYTYIYKLLIFKFI